MTKNSKNKIIPLQNKIYNSNKIVLIKTYRNNKIILSKMFQTFNNKYITKRVL